MKTMAALALAFALSDHDPDLQRDYQRTKGGTSLAMITLIARYEDGAPLRGYVSCAGVWFKHQDGEGIASGPSYPFRTDARGAIVMNPHMGDEWIVCSAEQDGYTGMVTVEFDADRPTAVRELVLRKIKGVE